MHLIIISGRSGSGKTVALKVLEDQGYYCVDNLPIDLLVNLTTSVGERHPKIAISVDARNVATHHCELERCLSELGQAKHPIEIFYLDATDRILLQRYSETRRKHPLTSDKRTLKEAIAQENKLLSNVANLATLCIDTSTLNKYELQSILKDRIKTTNGGRLQLLLQSFGYKFGLPAQADFVFDLRCLPNPYWQTQLRQHNGRADCVQKFFQQYPLVHTMLDDLSRFISQWLPRFEADNRSYVTIALGCTGGFHRSVYMVEALATALQATGLNPIIRHRDLPTVRHVALPEASSLLT